MGEEITSVEAAAVAGVARKTWSGYVARGIAPAPRRHVGRTPLWSRAEVEAWMLARPVVGVSAAPRGESAPPAASATDD